MEISAVRLANVRRIAETFGGSAEFARKVSKSDSHVAQFMGRNPTRKIGNRLAREIELALGLSRGALDVPPPIHSDIVREAANELEMRDEEAQRNVLELIRKIPPSSLAASMPSDEPPKKR